MPGVCGPYGSADSGDSRSHTPLTAYHSVNRPNKSEIQEIDGAPIYITYPLFHFNGRLNLNLLQLPTHASADYIK